MDEDILTPIKVHNYHMCEALTTAGAASQRNGNDNHNHTLDLTLTSQLNCPSSSTSSSTTSTLIIDVESVPLELVRTTPVPALIPLSLPSDEDEAHISSSTNSTITSTTFDGTIVAVGNGQHFPKRKRIYVNKHLDELCIVCGDRATGYHYNALSCEGCKGFFRRSITKNSIYQCKYGDNCEIDMYMRRKCQECRLKKCLSVGMKPESVLPESECAVKRQVKKARFDPTKTVLRMSNISFDENCGRIVARYGVTNLTVEQEELINRLVYFQDEFEQPTDEDLKRVAVAATPLCEDSSESRFRHITEMTILTVQLIVEFSKRLPGFDKLQREDQITLLKACSSEVMMLRTARRYDFQSDTIVFANNLPYTRDNYTMAGVGESADPLFNFCRQMCTKKVDNAEYALLTSIVIFSERPCLIEFKKVEKIQEIYIEALRAYVEYLDPIKPGIKFARLLNVLTELRTLGNINSSMCFALKQRNKKLPPFLEEIWDVKV